MTLGFAVAINRKMVLVKWVYDPLTNLGTGCDVKILSHPSVSPLYTVLHYPLKFKSL